MAQDKRPKRFYKTATTRSEGDQFLVLLDARVVNSPQRQPLRLPSLELAEAIADEWAAQGERIDSATMPMMALACTALDRIRPERAVIVETLKGYGAHELVCLWSDKPEPLQKRQAELWTPIVDWARVMFDAPLQVIIGFSTQTQPPIAVQALGTAVEQLDDWDLSGLGLAVTASGSLVISLALYHGYLSVQEAYQASLLEELYQAELWGEEYTAQESRKAIANDLAAVDEFWRLLGHTKFRH